MLVLATAAILGLKHSKNAVVNGSEIDENIVDVNSLATRPTMWPRFSSPIAELDQINKAARWDQAARELLPWRHRI